MSVRPSTPRRPTAWAERRRVTPFSRLVYSSRFLRLVGVGGGRLSSGQTSHTAWPPARENGASPSRLPATLRRSE